MTYTSTKILCVMAVASALGACSSSSTNTPTAPTPDTSKNFDSAGADKPIKSTDSDTLRGTPATAPVGQATYDQTSDTLTLTRTGSTDVAFVGSTTPNSNESDLLMFERTGSDPGLAFVATTSGGEGYAVAYDNTGLANDEMSTLVGGSSTTSTTPNLLENAVFEGQFLGQGEMILLGASQLSETLTADVYMKLDGTGTQILDSASAGTAFLSNWQGNGIPLSDVNITTTTGINTGTLDFSGVPIAMGPSGLTQPVTLNGSTDGAFYNATSNNDGEVVGSVQLQGQNGACSTTTSNFDTCAMLTGVFVAD